MFSNSNSCFFSWNITGSSNKKIYDIIIYSLEVSISRCVETFRKFTKKTCLNKFKEISLHWGINPPLSCQAPPPPFKSANCPSSLFRKSPLLYWFIPPKSRIFKWTSTLLKFFIFNPVLSFERNWILS